MVVRTPLKGHKSLRFSNGNLEIPKFGALLFLGFITPSLMDFDSRVLNKKKL
jgi:hypothetical protein